MRNLGCLATCAVVALSFAGCAGSAEKSRLPVGSEAILFHDSNKTVAVADRPAAELKGAASVPVGTRVTVLADDDKPVEISGKDYRDVRISVREGEYQNYVGKVSRFELRPFKP